MEARPGTVAPERSERREGGAEQVRGAAQGTSLLHTVQHGHVWVDEGAWLTEKACLPVAVATADRYTLHDGRVVYSKGNDHIIDAVRCAMLVREQGRLD